MAESRALFFVFSVSVVQHTWHLVASDLVPYKGEDDQDIMSASSHV